MLKGANLPLSDSSVCVYKRSFSCVQLRATAPMPKRSIRSVHVITYHVFALTLRQHLKRDCTLWNIIVYFIMGPDAKKVKKCAVALCSNIKNSKNIKSQKQFFSVPIDSKRRVPWCKAIDVPANKTSYFVCEDHFKVCIWFAYIYIFVYLREIVIGTSQLIFLGWIRV